METCIEIGEKELKNRLTKTGTPWYINYSTFSDGCSKTNKIPIKKIGQLLGTFNAFGIWKEI